MTGSSAQIEIRTKLSESANWYSQIFQADKFGKLVLAKTVRQTNSANCPAADWLSAS